MKSRTFKTLDGVTAFMQSQTARGHAWHMLVLHDDECTPYSCVCNPEYVVEPMTVETVTRGIEGERAWRRKSAS